jgi:outer membrane lipoprotein carrier protein
MHILLFILLSTSISIAQQDPAAKKILDKVHNYYEKASTLDITFTYQQTTSDIAGLQKKGQLTAKGEMFKLILDELEIYSDGKTQYTYIKKNKEVQITVPGEKESKYHPKQIASIYHSGTHGYSISKKIKEGKKMLTIVDFKPLDKKDHIAKIQLYIDEKTNHMERVQWIDQNGNKTNVKFTKSEFNKEIPDSSFVFDTKSVKGLHVEDLREE